LAFDEVMIFLKSRIGSYGHSLVNDQ